MEKMYLSKKFTEPLEREDIINSTQVIDWYK